MKNSPELLRLKIAGMSLQERNLLKAILEWGVRDCERTIAKQQGLIDRAKEMLDVIASL